MPDSVAKVVLWGGDVGAVLWDVGRSVGVLEFTPAFLARGLDIAPLTMPIAEATRARTPYAFAGRSMPFETFCGLPGLLADALPDKFGNAVIDAWLARQGRNVGDFNPVERLCYIGRRGMGALEFEPPARDALDKSVAVEIDELVRLAGEIVAHRSSLNVKLGGDEALKEILRVGTSAGGARPKAVLAINETTGDIRSGQVKAPKGYTYWVMKFDGVKDDSLGDPAGYGRIEFAYHRMARESGIDMTECRLYEEGGRAHFMTRRFDRTDGGGKIHMQSLCGMAHFDYNAAGAYAYEQTFQVIRDLRLPYRDGDQMFRRMVFNVVARNLDDHTKNIAFLMDEKGTWRLSPAFDVTYAHNPGGKWTNQHQMTVNGKRDGMVLSDFLTVAREMNVKNAEAIVQEVVEVVSRWKEFAAEAGIDQRQAEGIGKEHRLNL